MTKSQPLDALLASLGTVSGQIHGLDDERDEMIRAARKAGASWEVIGEAMGVSKQAAWERYRHLGGGRVPRRRISEEGEAG